MPYRPDRRDVKVNFDQSWLHDPDLIWPDDLFTFLEDKGWSRENIVRAIRGVTVVLFDRIGFRYERVLTPKDYLSQNDVGRLLSVPLMTVIRWCESGRLSRKRKNGYWVVKLGDVLALAANMGRTRLARMMLRRPRQRTGAGRKRERARTTRRAGKRAVQRGGKEHGK